MPDDLPLDTLPQVIAAARQRLTPDLWDYASGGAEDEVTLRRNRAAFESIALAPRVLRNVAQIHLATSLVGVPLALPVVLAPVGSVVLYDPAGALACARAAHIAGTGAFIGSLSSPGVEAVRAGSSGPLFFQLYASGGRDWVERLIKRVVTVGYQGLALTVDSSVYGHRERDIVNAFQRLGTEERPNLADIGTPDRGEMARLDWDYVDWLRGICPLPLMIKGIQGAEDALLAVEHGAQVVYVSNHGGRQLDHAAAAIELLPEIAAAVAGRAEIVVDSGFIRGTDVIKALASGARTVAIGKLMLYGLAAGGEAGLVRVLDLMRQEITVSLANMGVASIHELTPRHLRPSTPPPASIWPVQ